MLSSARYGLPPPPVPRIQAPIASDSTSSTDTGRSGAIGRVCYPAAVVAQTSNATLTSEAAMKTAPRLLVGLRTFTFVTAGAAVPAPAVERRAGKKGLR